MMTRDQIICCRIPIYYISSKCDDYLYLFKVLESGEEEEDGAPAARRGTRSVSVPEPDKVDNRLMQYDIAQNYTCKYLSDVNAEQEYPGLYRSSE